MTSIDPKATLADHVIGAFSRERLSAALAATHRVGFGPNCRVFDGARDDTARQLSRAGLQVRGDVMPAPTALLVVVTAPGRTAIVAELFHELGADHVYFAGRRQVVGPDFASGGATVPDVRVGEATEQ